MAGQQQRAKEGPRTRIDRVVMKIGIPLVILTVVSAALLVWWGLTGIAPLVLVLTALIFSLPVSFLFLLHDKIQRPFVVDQIKRGLGAWKMKEDDPVVAKLIEETLGERYFYWQVLLATVITFLGWLTVLLATGKATWNNADGLQDIVRGLTDNAPPVIFGFLGAYFFSNQYLIRRFLREDLKPQAFTQVAVRILSSTVIAFVISLPGLIPAATQGTAAEAATGLSTGVQAYTRWAVCAFAFLAGLTPYEVVLWIQDRISKRFGFNPRAVETEMRLDRIQGLTRWDEARLIEEGVENLQHLTTASPRELLVRTRFGAERIRDWMDQAYLLIHLTEDQRKDFMTNHIRTATDFIKAYNDDKNALSGKLSTAHILASSILEGPNSDFIIR
jgi:hypothetical protein